MSLVVYSSLSFPLLPWELLEEELPRHLPFRALLRLALVCRRLALAWKRHVKELPLDLMDAIDSEQLLAFPNLERLDLVRLSPQGVLEPTEGAFQERHLRALTALRTLRLGHREELTASTLERLTNLTELDLTGNATPSLICVPFSSLTKLRTLSLAGSLCRSFPDFSFWPFSVSSAVRRFNFTTFDCCLAKLSGLTALNLHDNVNVTAKGIAHLTALTFLNISSSLITLSSLPSLPSLKHVVVAPFPSQEELALFRLRPGMGRATVEVDGMMSQLE